MHRRFLWGAIPASLAAVVLVLFATGVLSPGSPSPNVIQIDGSSYSYVTVQIPIPPLGEYVTDAMVVVYENATFTLWLHWYSPGGGKLEGTLVEPDGTTLSFILSGHPSLTDPPWRLWMSPDGLYGVRWNPVASDGISSLLLLAKIQDGTEDVKL